ncbi:hypothetical protein K503DRAFT_796157 [Rhizopogon vinicolor AM-OR11-026]|uniref:Uncharacterized protein n=1 Tax=Rhizopogon vinicolor AM-OR11-026 TaxID=1314800 RepID=A0A1B7NFC9_9AGAM|nr:hypothetical protein K503DRAFT_796157 [Rhizopogon vinicolor AM-OR11-026]
MSVTTTHTFQYTLEHSIFFNMSVTTTETFQDTLEHSIFFSMSVTTTQTFQYTLEHSIFFNMSVTTTETFQYITTFPSSLTSFPQHPMTRSNARRPVKRSAANISLPQHVPERPISYYPSTVPSMPQYVLNKPLRVSCAPLVIDHEVPIKAEEPASSHETLPSHVLAMFQEIDEFINEIHNFTFPEGALEEFANSLAVGSTTPVPPLPSSKGTAVSLASHLSLSFKSFFRRLRSSVKSMPLTNTRRSGKRLFGRQVKI